MSFDKVFGELSSGTGMDVVVEEMLRASRKRLESELRLIRRPESAVATISSPIGPLMVAVGPRGVLMVRYLRRPSDAEEGINALRLKFDPVADEATVARIGNEIRKFAGGDAGALKSRADLALASGDFERTVLHQLSAIPHGAITTYQALGAAVGAARASRAVGNVMHRNPIPLYVPCHQVIRSDGSIGDYGGGVKLKIRLMRVEGFEIDNRGHIGGQTVLGHPKDRYFCRPDCSSLSGVDRRELLLMANGGRAKQAGMQPCDICHPV